MSVTAKELRLKVRVGYSGRNGSREEDKKEIDTGFSKNPCNIERDMFKMIESYHKRWKDQDI